MISSWACAGEELTKGNLPPPKKKKTKREKDVRGSSVYFKGEY